MCLHEWEAMERGCKEMSEAMYVQGFIHLCVHMGT